MSLAFISYSSRDREVARRVAEMVRVLGFKIWMDEGALAPGQPIAAELADAVAQVQVFIIILTKNSIESGWVQNELNLALARMVEGAVHVVPLVFDDCKIPIALAHLKWGDCRTTEGLVRSINLALANNADGIPLRPETIQRRYEERSPVHYAIRLVPSGALEKTGLLGRKERRYVFVGDYVEQCGRSLRQILSNLWAGDAYDKVANSNEMWTALVFEVGDSNVRKLDLLPATWKSMFRIVSDPKRLKLITITEEERGMLGRPPRDYYTPDQPYWYDKLFTPRIWRTSNKTDPAAIQQVAIQRILERLCGFSWWCFDGSGITQQGSRSSLASDSVASRLFLVKNLSITDLNCRMQELGHVDEGRLLI